jgi:hypothetical protein
MTDYIVGKHPEGWLVVNLRLETKLKDVETIEHEKVNSYIEFAASGAIWPRRNSPDCVRGGQMLDELWNSKQVAPWGQVDLYCLWGIWTRWHLNSMKAACAHQHVLHESSRGYDQMDLKNTKPCYETGYKLGSKWLYEPIPDRIITEWCQAEATADQIGAQYHLARATVFAHLAAACTEECEGYDEVVEHPIIDAHLPEPLEVPNG